MYGQATTPTKVIVTKTGQLKKNVSNPSSVTYLSISGPINNEDADVIASMTNLKVLDLREAEIDFEDKNDMKYFYFFKVGLNRTDRKEKRGFIKANGLLLDFTKKTNRIDGSKNKNGRFAKYSYFLNGIMFNNNLFEGNAILLPDLVNLEEVYLPLKQKGSILFYTVSLPKLSTLQLRDIDRLDLSKRTDGFSFIDNLIIVDSNNRHQYNLSEPAFKHTINTQNRTMPMSSVELALGRLTIPNSLYLRDESICGIYLSNIFPYLVKTSNDNKTTLIFWNKEYKSIYESNIDSLSDFAFRGCKDKTVTIPSKVDFIPNFCFTQSKVNKVIVPVSVKRMSILAFADSEVDTVVFQSAIAPRLEDLRSEFYDKYVSKLNSTNFLIPKDAGVGYTLGAWKRLSVIKEGVSNKLEIEVQKPGTLSQYITDSNADIIRELKIKGFLYDTDFANISKCKYLRTLDLKYAYITKSPKTVEAEKAKTAAILALLNITARTAMADAEKRYEQGKTNTGKFLNSHYTAKKMKEFTEKVDLSKIKADDKCIMPSLSGLQNLEKIVLPSSLRSWYADVSSTALKEVILPDSLEVLEGNLGYGYYDLNKISTQIKHIKFPSSLKKLGAGTFYGCENLEEVDLSNTQVESIGESLRGEYGYATFGKCKNLKYIKLPKSLKRVYNSPFDFDSYGAISTVGYFHTPEAPESCGKLEFKEIHIPRGCSAGWQDGIYCPVIDDL